jgi:hypothetical protein
MVSDKSRAPRSPNAAVRFSLPEYARRLGHLFSAEAEFRGPGPICAVAGAGHPTGELHRAVSYLFGELFSKFDDEKASESKLETCLKRFHTAEELCRDTNWRFKERNFLYSGTTSPGYTPAKAMWLARRKIEELLGEYSDAEILPYCGFGPGATTRIPRSEAHLVAKLGGIPQATREASSFVRDILPQFPVWEDYLKSQGAACQVVRGNKLVSVPKNYKSDRMIAIEPDWNLFLQKGIGGVLRRRLRKVGIELTDQSNNAFCAGLGSLYGDLATIDLSMASDCVAVELVRFLLPAEWYDALEQCRSPLGAFASGDRRETIWFNYQKFSSMGNGYTFELETLIFWALSSAVIDLMKLRDRRCLVYGDDIIVPTTAYRNVVDVLTLAGFVPNPDKSFGEGPFRESCGSSYLEGIDVTPIYVREAVKRLDRLFLLHNNTCRLLERYERFVTASPESIRDFLAWIRSHAPEQWRDPRLPRLDVGDGAFFGSFEECVPRMKRNRNKYDGWKVKCLQARTVEKEIDDREFEKYLARLWPQSKPLTWFLPKMRDFVMKSCGLRKVFHDHVEFRDHRPAPDPNKHPWELIWRVREQIVLGNAMHCWWHC